MKSGCPLTGKPKQDFTLWHSAANKCYVSEIFVSRNYAWLGALISINEAGTHHPPDPEEIFFHDVKIRPYYKV
jgi:hypothetical protein